MGGNGFSRKLRVLGLANLLCLAAFMAQALLIDANGCLLGIPAGVVGFMQSGTCLVGTVVAVWRMVAERRPRTWPAFALCVYLIAICASVIQRLWGQIPWDHP